MGGSVEWSLRRKGLLATDEHLESMVSGRLCAMTIEEAPAQLRLRSWGALTRRMPLLRTSWVIYRSSRRLYIGAGSGLLMPVDLAYLWRISIDEADVMTLVYSSSGLTALRFEKSRADKSVRSVWASEWVEEVTAARGRLVAAMTIEEKSWYELWRTELEESGALDRVESLLGARCDIYAPRDAVESGAWHLLLSALGSIGRDDSQGLALAMKQVTAVDTAQGALATAYARHLLSGILAARFGTEPTSDELDAVAHEHFERWSRLLSSVANYEVTVFGAALRAAAGCPFDAGALDGRRGQAMLTTLGVLLDEPVPFLVSARESLSDWAKRGGIDAKTAESIAASPTPTFESPSDLASNWALLSWAVRAGAYGDTAQFLARLVDHEKQFKDRAPGQALLFFALREAVLRRLEGRGSRTDLALLAAEAAPRFSRLLNRLEVVDLEELVEVVFQFRELSERLRGANFTIRTAGAIAVLLTNPPGDLDAISARVLEQAARMIEEASPSA